MPRGQLWSVTASFCKRVVIELGRAIRGPVAREPGVQTWETLWPTHRAVAAWLVMLVITAGFATLAAAKIHFTIPVVATLGTLLLIASHIAWNFITRSAERGTRNPEPLRTSCSALRVPPAGA